MQLAIAVAGAAARYDCSMRRQVASIRFHTPASFQAKEMGAPREKRAHRVGRHCAMRRETAQSDHPGIEVMVPILGKYLVAADQ